MVAYKEHHLHQTVMPLHNATASLALVGTVLHHYAVTHYRALLAGKSNTKHLLLASLALKEGPLFED